MALPTPYCRMTSGSEFCSYFRKTPDSPAKPESQKTFIDHSRSFLQYLYVEKRGYSITRNFPSPLEV